MNNENAEVAAYLGSPVLAGLEPVESIQDLLKKRGFFEPVETDDKQ